MTFSNFRNYGIAMFRMIPNDFVNMIHDIPSLSNYRDYGLVSRDWDWNHTFPNSQSLAANPLILLCSNHFLFGSVLGFPTGLTAIETPPVQRVRDNDVFSTSVTLELSNAFFPFLFRMFPVQFLTMDTAKFETIIGWIIDIDHFPALQAPK